MAAEDRRPFRNLYAVLRVPRTVHVIPGTGDIKVSYTSVLTDFNESSFYLTQPAKGHEEMPLEEGDEIRIVYYGDDAVYDFSTAVIGCHAGRPGGRRYEAAIPERCWRVQRRDSYRLTIQIDAEYRVTGDPIPCRITDVSGGGIAFRMNEPLEVGARIEVSFSLGGVEESDRVRERVEVVRVWPATSSASSTWAYGCGASFVEIDTHSRDRILRFIFLKQMESLARRRV